MKEIVKKKKKSLDHVIYSTLQGFRFYSSYTRLCPILCLCAWKSLQMTTLPYALDFWITQRSFRWNLDWIMWLFSHFYFHVVLKLFSSVSVWFWLTSVPLCWHNVPVAWTDDIFKLMFLQFKYCFDSLGLFVAVCCIYPLKRGYNLVMLQYVTL